jgi:MerR family redox-sensitive transcriptional activator SoxR
MKIGELARRADLNASAIRYYEKTGLLPAPPRSGGQRRYASEALDRVLLIRFAGEMGFTLGEIKLFLGGLKENAPVGLRWQKLATRKVWELKQLVARAQRLEKLLSNLSHCHCASLRECVRRLDLSENRRFLSDQRAKKEHSFLRQSAAGGHETLL